MNIAKVVKEELKKQHKTAKWLYEELQHYEEGGTYQWFAEKLKDNKLSAVDLAYISYILSLDLRRFTMSIKMKEVRKGNSSLHSYVEGKQGIIENSEVKNLDGQRLFLERDGVDFLLTYSMKEDAIILEEFDLQNKKSRMFTRLFSVSSIGGLPFKNIQEFSALSNEEKFKVIYELGKDYQVVFPEDYAEECPVRYFETYSEEEKKEVIMNHSFARNSGREGTTLFYLNVESKDWLLTYNRDEDFFCLEWFDFTSRKRRVFAFEEQWSAGDMTSQFFDTFEDLSDEDKFLHVKDAAKDYHYFSKEEYNEDYPVFSF